MKRAETTANQQQGKFKLCNQREFWDCVAALGDGRFRVTIEKIYRKRTLPMNSYLHGYLIPAVRYALIDAGYPKEEVPLHAVKEMLKRMFLTREIVNESTGEYIQITK